MLSKELILPEFWFTESKSLDLDFSYSMSDFYDDVHTFQIQLEQEQIEE